jgi:hypothetical protein
MKAIAILILATVLASSATAQSGDKMTAEQAREENVYALGGTGLSLGISPPVLRRHSTRCA